MKRLLMPGHLRHHAKYQSKSTDSHNDIHANDQLLTVFNSLSVGMLSLDNKGVIRLYNAALASLLDTNASLIGKKANTVFSLVDSDNKPVELMDLVKKTYGVRNDDISLRYEDGDTVRLGILINPIRTSQNDIDGYIFVIEDITREKSLEEERDEFISVISHELRTPITITEGSISNAQLLLERGAQLELLKKTFTEAHDQIVFLANMVNDLGTLSRAERGVGDTLEKIDIDLLAGELYAKYTPRATSKGLQFNLNIVGRVGMVSTSRLYLEEILQNLITNSIKYTLEGSVTLSIKKTASGVLFVVKDTGIGISKSDQKRIFEKFYRSEDYRTRESSGTGLGLYVVQKLAKKLNITIGIESHLNHGSTFSFTLPLKNI
ncbi:MAG TPA: HAMP domain-containing sensor histidine kinase [Candidatus Saccharibacteria bacterium]|nr:HAMP domain-containing sensor histidine kinase [Candidatus Saccharibacteria bacterium]